MDRTLWLALLFNYLLVIDCLSRKDECLTQPSRIIWRKKGQAAVLQCAITPHCAARRFRYEWFAFKENVHFRVDLSSNKYSLDGASLHIKSLQVNDSGIYHCASTASYRGSGCCAQHVGPGETLIVTDKVKTMVRHILLLLSFVLLAVYSIAVFTLILLKKKTSSKKRQFKDVLQEMHRKGNLEKNKDAVRGNHSQAEAAHNDSDDDGIYQNM